MLLLYWTGKKMLGCAGKSRKMWVTRDSCVKLQDNVLARNAEYVDLEGKSLHRAIE